MSTRGGFSAPSTSPSGMVPTLADRYRGRVVLLTGVTGFLGKVVLERLLWEFGEDGGLAELRVLIRGDAAARLEALWAVEIFDRLRARHGGQEGFLAWARSRVVACAGDVEKADLGMGAAAVAALRRGLHMVVHCAALVAWDVRIDRSINANALGTLRLLEATSVGNPSLTHFQYCSSAFTHGQRCRNSGGGYKCPEAPFDPDTSLAAELFPERENPPFCAEAEVAAAQAYAAEAEARFDAERPASSFLEEATKRALTGDGRKGALQIAASMRAAALEADIADWGVRRATSHGWNDNYTYSKALAEMLLMRNCPPTVRLSIVRPSGITACRVQPCVGWLDAYLLVEPLIHGVGTGKITAFPGNPAHVIDVVPADVVTSVMIAAAAVAGEEGGGNAGVCGSSCRGAPVAVYQVGSGNINPVTLGQIERIWVEYFKAHPMRASPKDGGALIAVQPIGFYPSVEAFDAENRGRYLRPLEWALWGLEKVPFWRSVPPLRAAWAKASRLAVMLRQVLRLAGLYCKYTLNEWIFDTARTERLMGPAGLADEDRASFCFEELRTVDWKHFWTEVHIPFMRRYLLKEDAPAAAPSARL